MDAVAGADGVSTWIARAGRHNEAERRTRRDSSQRSLRVRRRDGRALTLRADESIAPLIVVGAVPNGHRPGVHPLLRTFDALDDDVNSCHVETSRMVFGSLPVRVSAVGRPGSRGGLLKFC